MDEKERVGVLLLYANWFLQCVMTTQQIIICTYGTLGPSLIVNILHTN